MNPEQPLPNARLHAVNGALKSLSEADIAAFDRDGAIVLRGLLPSDLLGSVTGDLVAKLALLGAQSPEISPAANVSTAEASRVLCALEAARAGAQSAVYDAMSHAPIVHRVAVNDGLLECVQALLSPTIALHPRLIMLMSMPESSWHLALWHQDWYYNEGPASTVTAYIPLQATSKENGSLLLALGEHKNGLFDHGDYDQGMPTKWHTINPESVRRFERVAESELAVGDVLLFNSLVPHCARLNHSSHVRFVLNFRYRDMAESEFLANDWRIAPITHARQALSRRSK